MFNAKLHIEATNNQLSSSNANFKVPINELLRRFALVHPWVKANNLSLDNDDHRFQMWQKIIRMVHAWPGFPQPVKNLFASPASEVSQSGLFPITNFMYLTYQLRTDLHKEMDLKTQRGRDRFVEWYFHQGYAESDYPTFDWRPAFEGKAAWKEKFGVNSIGFTQSAMGLGEDNRMTASAMHFAGVELDMYEIELAPDYPKVPFMKELITNKMDFKISVFNLPPAESYRLLFDHGPFLFHRHYNIGFWQWELSGWPDQYKFCYELFNEIWTASEFVKNSLEKNSPVPVYTLPCPVTVDEFVEMRRELFGIPKDSFAFTFVFDFNSSMDRKNPMACLEAFRLAFPHGSEKVVLVIKTMNANESNPAWAALNNAAKEDSRIIVINEQMDKSVLLSLIKSSNAFVSLHRGEGFGRLIAEAMLLGVPTITTHYSGNADFCTPETSFIVDYDLIEVKPGEYSYVDGTQVWADARIDSAVRQMREVARNSERRDAVRGAAKAFIEKHYNMDICGLLYLKRLSEIYRKLPNLPPL